jgi:signal transduction histidine kinase/CheY-like chemotaxis protein
MAGLSGFNLIFPPHREIPGSVHRLVAQVSLLACCTALALALFLALQGAPLQAYGPMFIQVVGFLIAHIRARMERIDSFQMVLALVWLTVLFFDDGFAGSGITWVFYIPLAMGIMLFLPQGANQSLWLFSIPVGLALVAFTPWTPRLNALIPEHLAIASRISNFLAAIVSSLLALKYLLEQHDLALSRAEAASQAKSQFLSHMSHEFRTPLNAISGFTELLALETKNQPRGIQDNLQAIRTSADHLLHLVNDVLDLSRMENGKLPLHCTVFSSQTALEELALTLSPLARAKNLELRLDIDGELPILEGDRVRWLQILINLAGNAIRYTHTGYVRIHARWDSGRNQLVTIVQDTGPGIAKEKLASIFEPYTRLEEHQPSQAHGTGLGLAIARQLVDAMGGTLEVESVPDQGTAFLLRLPFALSRLPLASESPNDQPEPDLTGRRILLCEDTPMNVRLASQVLRKLGADFEVAEDGRQALALLRQGPWDLILLDLHMPYHDGYEVARQIRDPESDIPGKQVPILALTADASEATLHRTKQVGMNDCLTKPFKLSELAHRAYALIQR